MPAAPVVQVAGTQVPVAPALAPVTTNETTTPLRGVPLGLVTLAVTVWEVPTGFVAVVGVRVRFGASATIPEPAMRM